MFGLGLSSRSPGLCTDNERCGGLQAASPFAKPASRGRIDAGEVLTGRSDTECEWFPPILECGVFDVDRDRALLDVAQPGVSEKFGEVAVAGSSERGFVNDT